MKFPRLLGLGLALVFLSLAPLGADVPVPRRVLHPGSEAEAWNVIRLARENSGNLLKEERLGEIPPQIALCNPSLRTLAQLAPASHDAATAQSIAELTVLASVYINSMAQIAAAGDKATTEQTFGLLDTTLEKLGAFYTPELRASEIYSCPMHPDFTSTDKATPCDKCGMPLNLRRIPYSFVYVKAGEPYTRMSAQADGPMTAGKPVTVKLQLNTADGAPLPVDQLMVMHTEPIHLLIVDPSLQDYHHEHPKVGANPGEWEFTFTPKLSSPYRMFADIVPVSTGVQEYAFVDLAGSGETGKIPAHPNSYECEVEGLKFVLKFDSLDGSPPYAGEVENMSVTVTDAKSGEPVTGLVPIMNTFAHAVGFYEDYQNVLHLHPAGGDILDQKLRGGPRIPFKFYAPQAGYIRLYCQVLVGDKMIFAPFDINVPAAPGK